MVEHTVARPRRPSPRAAAARPQRLDRATERARVRRAARRSRSRRRRRPRACWRRRCRSPDVRRPSPRAASDRAARARAWCGRPASCRRSAGRHTTRGGIPPPAARRPTSWRNVTHLPAARAAQQVEILGIHRPPDDAERDVVAAWRRSDRGRPCAAAAGRRTAPPRAAPGCGENSRRVDAAEDDARPRIALVARDLPAVFADVQVTVKPAVGRHVARDVEPAAAEIGHEDAPPPQPRAQRRHAARQHVLLVAVHDGRVAERAPQLRRRSGWCAGRARSARGGPGRAGCRPSRCALAARTRSARSARAPPCGAPARTSSVRRRR